MEMHNMSNGKGIQYLDFLNSYQIEEISQLQVSRISNFENNIWDFSYLNNNKRASQYAFVKFQQIPDEFKVYIKLLALKQITLDNKSLSTVNKNIELLKTFSRDCISLGIKNVLTISVYEIKEYFMRKEKSNKYSYLERLASTIKSFLINTGEYEKVSFKKATNFLIEKQQKYSKYETKKALNDYIPDEFYNNLVSCAIKDSYNKSLRLDERIVACLLIILAETGMRAEELSQLKTNRLRTHAVNNEKQVNYLIFETYKTTKSSNSSEQTQSFMTEIGANAYKLAEELVDEAINNLSDFVLKKRIYELATNQQINGLKFLNSKQVEIVNQLSEDQYNEYKTNLGEFLFISSRTGLRRIGTHPLVENYKKFIIRNYKKLNVNLNTYEKDNLNYFQIDSKSRYIKFHGKDYRSKNSFEVTRNIKYPYVNLHRFRTTVCTKLFKQQVHIDFIMKHMNHISADMTNYYNKSFQQENELEKSMEHINGLINEQGLLITNKQDVTVAYIKNELELNTSVKKIEKINEFLLSNNLNIKKDVKEVLKILKRTNSPAVENEFGMCLRSIIHSVCERRKYFHTFDDNYSLEINLDSYKFLNFEYEKFKQKLEIVIYNKELCKDNPAYSTEFEREVKTLNKFINNVLIKQLESINRDIESMGENKIVEEYPNLKEIVNSRTKILCEVRTWKTSLNI
ncbi:tyrosine-type recombinase/integrase [Virgibacillus flavescens]|uniref:tyrosine-type recombinase/integrase n=1 Tax=Virgibacillus flavescens TaxID=1611422 RepID=UPI003D33BDEF